MGAVLGSDSTCKHETGDNFVCRITAVRADGTPIPRAFIYKVTDEGRYEITGHGPYEERLPSSLNWTYWKRGRPSKAPSPVPTYVTPSGPRLPFFRNAATLPQWMGGGHVPNSYWGVCGTTRVEEVTNDGCSALATGSRQLGHKGSRRAGRRSRTGPSSRRGFTF